MPTADRRVAVAIARQYYLEGLSKVEIAKAHDLSRFKVARILEESLASGLVRIEIAETGIPDAELSEQLRQRYDLRHAVVVSGPFSDATELRASLGQAAAELLTGMITAKDVLGIAWGRTLSAMASQVKDLPPCKIVQLTGIAGSAQANSVDLVRQLLSASRGAHYPLYAPLLVSDGQTATALARQPSIRTTMAQWRTVTVAMVAVGSWDPEGSQLYPVLEPADHDALTRHHIDAEMCALLFDTHGRPVKTSLTKRTIGIPYLELMQIPEVIAVAGGTPKASALHSILIGRAVTSIVTDADTAKELLAADTHDLRPRSQRRRRHN